MNSKKIILSILIFSLIISLVFAIDNAEEFRNRNGKEWYVAVTPEGLILTAYRFRPDEIGPPISREKAIETAKNFLDKNSDIIGLENFKYVYDQLNNAEHFSYWTIDFKADIINGMMPPHSYLKVFMTRDGQVYAIGDIDMMTIDFVDSFQKDTIPENKAIESAKTETGSNSEVSSAELASKIQINGTTYPIVWDIKFGSPDNKEVLIDAKTGKVLSTKEIGNVSKLTIFSLFSNPLFLLTSPIIAIIIIFVIFIFVKRMRSSKKEDSLMASN